VYIIDDKTTDKLERNTLRPLWFDKGTTRNLLVGTEGNHENQRIADVRTRL
jgi:hypothetical protein